MICCDDPRPRIAEKSGRVFCASCRQFLDTQASVPDPLRDDSPEEVGEPIASQEGAPQ